MNNMNEYEAIEFFLGIKDEKKKSKRQILWQYYVNIFQGLLVAGISAKILYLLRRKMILVSKLKNCQRQEPLEVETVPHLIQRWEQGNYRFNSMDLLQSQLDGIMMKNVFIIGKCKYKARKYMAGTDIDVYLHKKNDIAFIEGQSVKTRVNILDKTVQEAFFNNPNKQQNRSLQMNIDLPVQNVRPNNYVPYTPTQLLRAIFSSLFGLPFLSPKLKLAYGHIILKPQDSLCAFTDLIYDGKNMRLINTKWLGNSFSSLSKTVIEHYKEKISQTNKSIIYLGLGILAVGAYRLYSRLNKTITKLQIKELEQKYPRITEVTQPLEDVVIQQKRGEDPLICQICRTKNVDLIFIPCYHFQICRGCMDISGTLCTICNKNVYCGIPVYFA